MFVKTFSIFLIINPFYQAFLNSDFLGKLIYLSLIATSIYCWTLLIQKIWLTQKVKRNAQKFRRKLLSKKGNPLHLEEERLENMNPFFDLFLTLKEKAVDLLNKNQHFGFQERGASCLSPSDMDHLEAHLFSHIALQTKQLEKNLFVLSTIAGLAPLLGLLGTVWGILVTFSALHTQAGMNQAVLEGISLALTTTVLGLLTAIPALIAYNYLRNAIQNFAIEMESFSQNMLSSIEMYYGKVERS